MNYLQKLPYIASIDVEELNRKEATYRGSWKNRGGVGAFMMLARKWDRLETICRENGWDIFKAVTLGGTSEADGTALSEIRDLRRYLLLVEAEMLGRMKHDDGTPKEDSNRHAAATPDSGEHVETRPDTTGLVRSIPRRLGSGD